MLLGAEFLVVLDACIVQFSKTGRISGPHPLIRFPPAPPVGLSSHWRPGSATLGGGWANSSISAVLENFGLCRHNSAGRGLSEDDPPDVADCLNNLMTFVFFVDSVSNAREI